MCEFLTKGRELSDAISKWQPIHLPEAMDVLRAAMPLNMQELSVYDRLALAQIASTVAWHNLDVTISMLENLWPVMRLEEDEALGAMVIVRNIQKCRDPRVREIAHEMLADARANVSEQATYLFGETYAPNVRA